MQKFLVDTTHKLAYYPIPKVASSLIKRALCASAGITINNKDTQRSFITFYGESVPLPVGGRARLALHAKANKALSVSPEDLNDLFVFTFVRNPLRRLVSVFVDNQFLVCRRLGQPPSKITFRKFVRFLTGRVLARENRHWRPQVCFVNEMPTDAFVGRLEEFAAGWKHIHAKTGFTSLAPKPRVFPVTRDSAVIKGRLEDIALPSLPSLPNWRAFYPKGLKEKVAQLYSGDMQRFGYK